MWESVIKGNKNLYLPKQGWKLVNISDDSARMKPVEIHYTIGRKKHYIKLAAINGSVEARTLLLVEGSKLNDDDYLLIPYLSQLNSIFLRKGAEDKVYH